MLVVGFLASGSQDEFADRLRPFRQGLDNAGYVERKNVTIEYRWAEGQYDRLPALAADLVRQKIDVFVTAGGVPAALAAKAATTTIPIIFVMGGDPIELGLVASLSRPGGNITGFTSLAHVGGKQFELLYEMVPVAAMGMGLLVNPSHPSTESFVKIIRANTDKRGRRLVVVYARNESDFEAIFAMLLQQGARALVVQDEPLFNSKVDQLAALAARHAMPAIHGFREFAAAGGLMSYGGRIADTYHQLGVYTGRILKGEKPADLPVQQPTNFDLVINLKTAKALGLTVPAALLARADEVME